uniref:hypothetical protein n=1 Tax=Gelidibacter sp. TaxID=2018083 RepID=UPI00404ADCB5
MTTVELRLNIKEWESKRWIFNILVVFSVAISFYLGYSEVDFYWSSYETIGAIKWLFGANLFYCLGILTELFDWYYFKNKIGIVKFRFTLFLMGTFFSCLWTFLCIRMHSYA